MIRDNKEYFNVEIRNKSRMLKILTTAILVGTSFYAYPSLASNLSEDVTTKIDGTHGNKIAQESLQNILTLQIPSSVKDEFEAFLQAQSNEIDVYKDFTSVMQASGGELQRLLPLDVQEILKEMGRTGNPGIVHIKGLPIDSHIPLEGSILDKVAAKGKVSESLMLGLAYVMGCEARPNPNEQGGRIIHNVAPVKGFEKTPSSRGKEPLYLHTEEAFEDFPPDFLMLYGLVGDPKAGTAYHFIDDFLGSFPQHIVEEMKKPQFKIKSNSGGLDQPTEGTYSLITTETHEEQGDKLRLRLYGNMEDVTPLTDKAKEVVNYVNHFFKSVHPRSISLNPGEAIIFNNGWGINKVSGIMHGRAGAIQNPYRWLQRAFLFQKNSK